MVYIFSKPWKDEKSKPGQLNRLSTCCKFCTNATVFIIDKVQLGLR